MLDSCQGRVISPDHVGVVREILNDLRTVCLQLIQPRRLNRPDELHEPELLAINAHLPRVHGGATRRADRVNVPSTQVNTIEIARHRDRGTRHEHTTLRIGHAPQRETAIVRELGAAPPVRGPQGLPGLCSPRAPYACRLKAVSRIRTTATSPRSKRRRARAKSCVLSYAVCLNSTYRFRLTTHNSDNSCLFTLGLTQKGQRQAKDGRDRHEWPGE